MIPPILITGAARSGTSMTGGTINICGAYGGKLSEGTRFNPKGMFENGAVRNTLVKPFLRSINCDPLGQNPLPKISVMKNIAEKEKFVAEWKRKFLDLVFESRNVNRDSPWFYKGAKMCLMWPLWHAAFPDAKWVIVRRDTEDIVASCLRTSFMRAYRNRSGWLLWVSEHERRFEEMIDAGLNVVEVWPHRMIAGDFSEIQLVINKLGLKWERDKVVDFIDPGLWRRWKGKKDRVGVINAP